MSRYLALLRAVNVGGTVLSMAALRELAGELGFAGVSTYLQSGNLVFSSSTAEASVLERRLAEAILLAFALEVTIIVRSAAELELVIAHNPFLGDERDPTKLHVTFLAADPDPTLTAALEAPAGIRDRFALAGRTVYLHCPDGYGSTKLNNAFFERRLRTRATTRNWRSVGALYALVAP